MGRGNATCELLLLSQLFNILINGINIVNNLEQISMVNIVFRCLVCVLASCQLSCCVCCILYHSQQYCGCWGTGAVLVQQYTPVHVLFYHVLALCSLFYSVALLSLRIADLCIPPTPAAGLCLFICFIF